MQDVQQIKTAKASLSGRPVTASLAKQTSTCKSKRRDAGPPRRTSQPQVTEITMKIAVYGNGNVGAGLARLWELKGHHIRRLGRNGGDVSQVEVILLAVPGDKVEEALLKLKGIEGKLVIDATNLINAKPPAG